MKKGVIKIMEEDMINIDELEHFNPFISIKYKCNDLIYCGNTSIDLAEQQRHFIQMACYDGREEKWKRVHLKHLSKEKDKEEKKILRMILEIQKRNELNDWLYSRYFARETNLCSGAYTKERAIKLNKIIKLCKTTINRYIKIIETHNNFCLLNKVIGSKKCKRKIPYVFYLQEIIKTLNTMYDPNYQTRNHIQMLKKLSCFKNDKKLLNFQGCLGLLLLNEFCFYYKTNQVNLCIFCSILITYLYHNSPIYKIIEKKHIDELNEALDKVEKNHNDRLKGSAERANKYTLFRAYFKEEQRKAFLKNPKLIACHFAIDFINKHPNEIPYTYSNREHKLIKLAEENNREFKKTLASYGS